MSESASVPMTDFEVMCSGFSAPYTCDPEPSVAIRAFAPCLLQPVSADVGKGHTSIESHVTPAGPLAWEWARSWPASSGSTRSGVPCSLPTSQGANIVYATDAASCASTASALRTAQPGIEHQTKLILMPSKILSQLGDFLLW